MSITETRIRDFIALQIENGVFLNKISNLNTHKVYLENYLNQIMEANPVLGGPTPDDLVKGVMANRLLNNLDCLESLELLGIEFRLSNVDGRGRKPSSDILAINVNTKALIIIEVKRSAVAERQAVSELSCYSNLFQERFFGINSNNVVWIPISTIWTPHLIHSFMDQILFGDRIGVPLKADIKIEDGEIVDIEFEILDFLEKLDLETYYSLFAWDSFDGVTINFKEDISDVQNLMHIINVLCSKYNNSGFVFYTRPNAKDFFMYPFGIVIGIYNPFKGFLKKTQLKLINDQDGEDKMIKAIREPLWSELDVDLKTNEIFSQYMDESITKSFISIRDIAINSDQGHRLLNELEMLLDLLGNEYELSYPDLYSLINSSDYHFLNAIEKVFYFGLMEYAVLERMKYDIKMNNSTKGDYIISSCLGDPIETYSYWDYFLEFMDLMNFDHASQEDLFD